MRKFRTIALWIAILVGFAAFDSVWACSCSRMSRDEGIKIAQNVFEGRVISVRPLADGERIPKLNYFGAPNHILVTRFQVIRSIKGNLSGDVDVVSGSMDSSCGINYSERIGAEFTVGTQPESEPDNVTSLCLDYILNPADLILQRRFKTTAAIKYSEFRIIDGDTIRLDGMKADTRLVGLNAPETAKAQCETEKQLGGKARQRLHQLSREGNLEFRFVACSCPVGTEGTDACNYGRSCGTLTSNGRDVADILIDEKLAVPFQCSGTRCPKTPRPWCEN